MAYTPQESMSATEYLKMHSRGKSGKAKTKRGPSHLETALEQQIALARLPKPVREYRFHPVRKWRFDFAWPELMIACEVEGGLFIQGGHSRGAAYEDDCEKYNAAALLGWTVYRFPGNFIGRYEGRGRKRQWVDNTRALDTLMKAMEGNESGSA